jgi:Fic-DOC domain mobile mystery protein B
MEVTDLGEQAPDATPLDKDDLAGLRPSWVSTRGELNQVEADNIFAARVWAFERRGRLWYIQPDQLDLLHERMLGDVWSWAGHRRRRETNIGVDPDQIPIALHDLCDDVRAQIGDGTSLAYPADELAVRFHHRLVASIHTRTAMAATLGWPPISWCETWASRNSVGEHTTSARPATPGSAISPRCALPT